MIKNIKSPSEPNIHRSVHFSIVRILSNGLMRLVVRSSLLATEPLNVTLDFKVNLGKLVGNINLHQALNSQGDPFCYTYKNPSS